MGAPKNEAVGTYEAAALMGVHFTRPKRMADMGLIACRELETSGGATFAVYSSEECNANFEDYVKNNEARRQAGEKVGRPRGYLDDRRTVLRVLSDSRRPQISFEDAIGVVEAAKILGVFFTRVLRIVEEGKIVGRIVWSERGSRSRLWILSRSSVESHAAVVRKLEASGLKKGRPRGSPDRKK